MKTGTGLHYIEVFIKEEKSAYLQQDTESIVSQQLVESPIFTS